MDGRCIDAIMKVSVIIPTYKPGEYIDGCLSSLSDQTLNKHQYEIILVLNGCKDPYEEYLRLYCDKQLSGNIVRILQTDEAGVSNARNIGIENASGEYICFIDDDDIVSSNYLEALLSASSPSCIGCSNSMSFYKKCGDLYENFLTRHYLRCKGKKYSQLRYRGFLSPPVAKMLHRNIIAASRFDTKLKYSEDSVFCFDIAKRIGGMKLTDSFYYINEREGSATRRKDKFPSRLKQLLLIEMRYIEIYLKSPFSYNILFLFSRMAGAVRNLISGTVKIRQTGCRRCLLWRRER